MSDDKYDNVVKQLCELFQGESANLMKVFAFLQFEEERCQGRTRSGVWNMMASLLTQKKELKVYAEDLLKKATPEEKKEVDEKFVNMQMEIAKHFDTEKALTTKEILQNKQALAAAIGLSFWMEIPHAAQEAIIGCIFDNLTNVPGYTLAAVFLAYEIGVNIYKWHNGTISGKRCAKDVLDSAACLGAGIGGGVAGAAFGALCAGPVGAVIGGLAGGFVASFAGQALMNLLTTEIFDLPKTVALEKAYTFLGVSRNATDEQVKDAYKKRLLECHPDKGGSQELFVKLQSYLGIICVARGWAPKA
ncbi:unnamed protein product, partial [Mesorhabditis belari]|uniref:J domain-containing protein n=1 Tax=Mesorhabditis belari TaxID=2138241 RepID=A0AAF3EJI0_9BILA